MTRFRVQNWLRTIALVSLGGIAWAGCGRTATKAEAPPEEEVPIPPPPPQRTESGQLDLLFVVDNTTTAEPSHAALAQSVRYLLDRLVVPRCVNGLGQILGPTANGECEVGLVEFAPVTDIHIGVISTSIGGHGADTCSPASSNYDEQQNDGARLLQRAAGGEIPTYRGLGFFVWDPEQTRSPPGDSDLDALKVKVSEAIVGAGARGCGYEAPMEAFYRFLIEPAPYGSIEVANNNAVLTGVDDDLLAERAAFLRPDSALAIVVVTDEDDCSIRDGGQFFFAAQSDEGNYHLPRPRAVCASDPDDACCTSCGASAPANCGDDPTCSQPLTVAEDPINLRCFDQKRRFGLDFLWPVDRYTTGLSELSIADRFGDVVANPLFTGARTPAMVTLAMITGVPWQDISVSEQSPAAGFLPTHELNYARLLGDGVDPPRDPMMIQSRTARTGEHPVTGEALGDPESTDPRANRINGHEHQLTENLQYACTYPLDPQRPCTPGDPTCQCFGAAASRDPLCQNDDGSYDDIQRYASATPGTRNIELLRELPGRGALGSICSTAETDPNNAAFGYRPSIDALLRSLRRSLVKP